uniref:50S ribosomal protein L32 n=1 Tax=Nitzschia alba TaxID=2858 RepID=A0A5C0F2J2_NITAL|nr:50S ribosomal protein L32 [Nitzschia alba]QEI59576.1 50S ribosomal protein L32 [Nitzschia alba]
MAVPKKKTSKPKKNSRKANWIRKSYFAKKKALVLANSNLQIKLNFIIKKENLSF